MIDLDELTSDWLAPAREEDFSLPAITNFGGMVQAMWGVAGIQNWICPPTGMATPTATLFVTEGGRVRRLPTMAEYRWRAFAIERRGSGVTSELRMAAQAPAVLERLRFDRDRTIHLVFGGLPRVWRFTDYWNLPPWDVPMRNVRCTSRGFRLDDTKTFGVAEFTVPGERRVFRDLQAWLDGEPPQEQGEVGVATLTVRAGDEVRWHGVQGCEETLPAIDFAAEWAAGEAQWRRTWRAAFTPGNAEFSGHLPEYRGEFARLYAMSVLTLLQVRRQLPPPTERAHIATGGQCIWSEGKAPLATAYVALGPEGGMTTSFLWELSIVAPLLARLDPAVLRAQIEAMLHADIDRHWGVEIVSGAGAGMQYGINAGALLSCVSDYVRVTGDRAFALRHVDALRRCCRTLDTGSRLTDYGACQNILECVSTYEHRIAAFNALHVQGLRFVADLTGDATLAAHANARARDVLALYAGGPFACLQPDGTRRVVRTVLDFLYVGRSMTDDLPADVRAGMLAFFVRELQTADWLRALSLRDQDALTRALPSFQTFRADHQATGAYDGWPALAASVLLRFGARTEAIAWLRRIQALTHEGPFGQAHFVHPDGARKASFYNGNCYWGAAGSAFATVLLEELGEA